MTTPAQATLISIADAVCAALQTGCHDGAFSQEFTPGVLFNTELKIEASERAQVGVVPGRVAKALLDRGSREGDYTVDIAVRRIINPSDDENIKSLFLLQEEIEDYLFHLAEDEGRRLPAFPDALWASADLKWPYVPELLRSHNQFTGICWVTYHVFDLT